MADAFLAGVEPGGLTSAEEIKVLICYMLRTVGQAMSRDEVTDIIVGEGMANYFDVEQAMDDLIRMQHLVQDDRMIATTVTGHEIGESLSIHVPYTLREKSVRLALELLRRHRTEEDNKVEIRRLEEGGCEVACSVLDRGEALLTVTLRVADEWQAEQIREHFLADPSLLYRGTLAMLTGDAGMRRAGTQLVIRL